MDSDTDAIVTCPSCGDETPIEDIPADDTCPNCNQAIPEDAPTKIRREAVDGNWDKIVDDDHSPIGGTDYDQDEISKPERDIETITNRLTAVTEGDVLGVTIGAQEEQSTVKVYVIGHERDAAGFTHRVSFVPKPQNDGWTRLYVTGIGKADLDPWKVVSAPYDLGGDQTADMRDFAGNGWLIDIETARESDE